MKIVDCFLFYNETTMLEYRLETLWDVVDYFVVVDSKYTFSGKPKNSYIHNVKNIEKYKSKIVYVLMNDCPYKIPNINYAKNQQWMNEYHQRDGIIKGINNIKHLLSLDDCIIISDVDEIPDRETLKRIKNEEITIENGIQSLEHDMYYYNLNHKLEDKWYSSKILTYRKFMDMYSKSMKYRYFIHFIRLNNCKPLERGGWHLSYFGDEHFIKNKIENFSHQELNTPENTNLENIRTKIKETNISLEENSYLPYDYTQYFVSNII